MQISAIVAMSDNLVIGSEGEIPWRQPADMKRFKEITMGNIVVMGRKTWDSIPAKYRPLPGRDNIVLSRDPDFKLTDAHVFHDILSMWEVLLLWDEVNPDREVIIIGGDQIYKLFMPRVARVYLTTIHAEFEGDAWFPDLDLKVWETTDEMYCHADEKNHHFMTFSTMERRAIPEDSG